MLTLILHNIRSVHNVGSIFRTADAAGVSTIILSGYTPTPLDRFGRERKDFTKVSLGAEASVPWQQVKSLAPMLTQLKKEGYVLAALEQDKNSTPLFAYATKSRRSEVGTPTKASENIALIVGNEVRGVSPALRKKVDVLLEIPMRGKKESLNVSVAAGIALFALLT
ncbi:MAG TPA: TrmH family RNA methyltransferase [Candidatus Paceibacterota bacterium]|nr:TrmH family RNA methyltransferase [Candidatus Paceibacterota bacterium]